MRRWLLILLIALLPLQGGAGGAMASGMAADTMKPVVENHLMIPDSIANYQEYTGDICRFSSENTILQRGDGLQADRCGCIDGGDGPATARAACAGCQSCASGQACHCIALAMTAALPPLPAAAAAVPTSQALAFDSAIPNRGLRPPIS